jgi:hypothetical protein
MGLGPRLFAGNNLRPAWSKSPKFVIELGADDLDAACEARGWTLAAAIRVVGGNGVAVLTGR